jgi:hypothetical protein
MTGGFVPCVKEAGMSIADLSCASETSKAESEADFCGYITLLAGGLSDEPGPLSASDTTLSKSPEKNPFAINFEALSYRLLAPGVWLAAISLKIDDASNPSEHLFV